MRQEVKLDVCVTDLFVLEFVCKSVTLLLSLPHLFTSCLLLLLLLLPPPPPPAAPGPTPPAPSRPPPASLPAIRLFVSTSSHDPVVGLQRIAALRITRLRAQCGDCYA